MQANLRRIVVLAVFALALNIAASAQATGHQVRAKIPFDFHAGDRAMPAGDYTFTVNLQNDNTQIYRADGRAGTFLLGSPYDGSSNGVALLTFRISQDGGYVLQKLQIPDVGLSYDVSAAVSRSAQNNGENATQVIVATLLR